MRTQRSARLACVVVALSGARCSHPRPDSASGATALSPRVDRSECPTGLDPVWRGRFDDAGWLSGWDPAGHIAYGAENAHVADDPRFGGVLRVAYPAGSASHSFARQGHPEGGLEFKARLPDAGHAGRSTASVSYWVRFSPNFQWIRGGKLPGLCGGSCPSGGADVTGRGGWSMRMMWRAGGAGEQYAYILPAREYGTELGLGAWRFTTGSWHRIVQEVVLNAPGRSGGVTRVWYDTDPADPPTFEARDITFRLDGTPADTLFFSTFFGGHDDRWATPVDVFAEFADFIVCR
jgi:hypothetical protein